MTVILCCQCVYDVVYTSGTYSCCKPFSRSFVIFNIDCDIVPDGLLLTIQELEPFGDFQLFFFFNIYLFIWLCRVLVAARRIFSCGTQALLVATCMRDLNSLSRDRTRAPCIGSAESYPLDHQGSPFPQF